MYEFHVSLRARPPEARFGASIVVHRQPCQPLIVPQAALATPLPLSFETACQRLEQLERMFVEPDGSFVWVSATSAADGPAWQVDGNLYDRDGRLLHVELHGRAPPDAFDRLLSAFGWPAAALMFEWIESGVYVSEDDFRRLAGG